MQHNLKGCIMSEFPQLPDWCKLFNFYHHSPTSGGAPDGLAIFDKSVARPAKIFSPPNTPMVAGTEGEEHAKRVVISGQDHVESYRHALAKLQEHVPAPWDEKDKQKQNIILNKTYQSVPLDKEGSVFELTLEHLTAGLREAVRGENVVEDGPWISLNLKNLTLPYVGQIDVMTRGVVELKTQWPFYKQNSKTGFSINSLPAKPKPEHISQVAIYHSWMMKQAHNVPVTIVYANCRDFRVFSSQDCEDLSPARLSDAVDRLYVIAKTRENLMSKAKNIAELFGMIPPSFDHWMWNGKSPEYKALAEQVWSM